MAGTRCAKPNRGTVLATWQNVHTLNTPIKWVAAHFCSSPRIQPLCQSNSNMFNEVISQKKWRQTAAWGTEGGSAKGRDRGRETKGEGGGNGSAEVYFSGKHILLHYRCSIMRASSYIAANVICVYSNKPNKQKEHNQGWHFTKKKVQTCQVNFQGNCMWALSLLLDLSASPK